MCQMGIMSKSGPGQSHRQGITLPELVRMFPDDADARKWFETVRWANGRTCPNCGTGQTNAVPRESPSPYHCLDCRRYFSVLTRTVMAHTKMGFQKWAVGLFLMSTSLKGVSNMKLHRDLHRILEVTEKTGWMLAQKIRHGWLADGGTISGEGALTLSENLQDNRGRGRPVQNQIDRLPATADEIADAILCGPDRRRER